MSKLASIYVWLFVAAVFIATNIWILNGFESKMLYAEQEDPCRISAVLKNALKLSQRLCVKSRSFETDSIKLARDPFILRSMGHTTENFKYSAEKKFFKAPPVALQLPRIDGILTIKKVDGTELKFLLVHGKVLKIGESIDGFKVVKVSPNSVLMRAKGKEFRIAFSKKNYTSISTRTSKEEQ